MPEFAATTLRTCLRFGLFILAFPLLAHAGLPLSSSVPGGVAVIPLGSVTGDTHTPQTWLGDRPVLVTADHNEWYAVVGLPLDITPGQHQLRVKIGDITKEQDFTVSTKEYPEQRITLKDKSKVELSAKDEARAVREIAKIKKLKLHWRTVQNPELTFILPVKGACAVSSTGNRAHRTPAWMSRCREARRSRQADGARCWRSGIIFSTARQSLSTMVTG
jgi:hypothetical protein